MAFAVDAVVNPEVSPPMGWNIFSTHRSGIPRQRNFGQAWETFPKYHRNHRTLSSLSS